MACDLSLLVTAFNAKGDVETRPLSINLEVEETADITLDMVVDAIAKMPLEERALLSSNIKKGSTQSITTSLLRGAFNTGPLAAKDADGNPVKRVKIVGNTTLTDLQGLYPGIAKSYNIKNVNEYNSYTIITGSKVIVNGVSLNGRVNINGQNVFVLTSPEAVRKFFSYLQAKETAEEIFGDEDNIPEAFQKYIPELQLIAKHESTKDKKFSVLDVIMEYLNYGKKMDPFVEKTDSGRKVITPQKTLARIVSEMTNSYNEEERFTDLEWSVKNLLMSIGDKYEWTITKDRLYNVLSLYFPDFESSMSKEEFRSKTKKELDALFTGPNGLFAGHPTLFGARVDAVTYSQRITETEDITEKKISEANMKKIWPKLVQVLTDMINTARQSGGPEAAWLANFTPPTEEGGYKAYFPTTSDDPNYIKALQKFLQMREVQKVFDEVLGVGVPGITEIETKNGTKQLQYTYTKTSTKVKTTGALDTIKFTFPWLSYGEAYGVNYETQSLFTPTTEGPVVGGEYNGMYLYEATVRSHGIDRKVYAISRSIISPKERVRTFPTLQSAINKIDNMNQKDSIGLNGLISIKQVSGMPRQVKLELKEVAANQIVSVLDIKVPVSANNKIPASQHRLLSLTLPQFHAEFAGVENIETLNTPEKAAAFIYKIYGSLRAGDLNVAAETGNFQQALVDLLNSAEFYEQTQEIINEINSARKVHYHIESIDDHKVAKVRLLRQGGTDIDLTGSRVGNMSTKQFLGQTLVKASEHLKAKYNIEVEVLSVEELEELSDRDNLGIKDKLKTIKAFVHNGKIYLNRATAHNSDLYHEVAHIMMGILRVHNPEAYVNLLKHYETKRKQKWNNTFDYVRKNYKLANQDLQEEVVANIIGDDLNINGSLLQDDFNTAAFDALISDIFKDIQQITDLGPETPNSFDEYVKTLVASGEASSDGKEGKLVRKRKLAALVEQLLAGQSEKVIEECT